MGLNFACALFSTIMTIAGLVLFILYVVKIRKVHIRLIDFLGGVIVCFFAKQLIYALIVRGIGLIPGIASYASAHYYFQPLLSVVINTFVTIGGFWLLLRVFYGNRFTGQNASSIAAGASVIEVLYNMTSPLVSLLSYFYMENNGTLESSISKVYGKDQVKAIIAQYRSFTPSYYLYYGAVALMVIANHYLIQTLFRDAVATRQRYTLIMMTGIVIAYSFFYYFANPLTMPWITIGAYALAAAQFIFAHITNKRLDQNYPKSIGVDY